MRVGSLLCLVVVTLTACSSSGDGECARLHRQLDEVETHAERIDAESFDEVEALQQLQVQGDEIRADLELSGCT